MRIRYYPDIDMLRITLSEPPLRYNEGAEFESDVVLHYDVENRIVEIEVEHASERVDLDSLRKSPHFSEHAPAQTDAAFSTSPAT